MSVLRDQGVVAVRLRRRLGVMLLGLCLRATVSDAQNVLQNPGFETGNTTGWAAFGPTTISVETTQVHSGTYAAQVQNRTATWNGISQSLVGLITPGQLYNFSGWVRLPSGSTQ